MSYSLIDLSESLQDNRYPITNDFGLLYRYLIGVRRIKSLWTRQNRDVFDESA